MTQMLLHHYDLADSYSRISLAKVIAWYAKCSLGFEVVVEAGEAEKGKHHGGHKRHHPIHAHLHEKKEEKLDNTEKHKLHHEHKDKVHNQENSLSKKDDLVKGSNGTLHPHTSTYHCHVCHILCFRQ